MRTIALYTTETMADWEYAYLTTQIRQAERMRPGRFRLLRVGDGRNTVTSLGGLPITPEADLSDLGPLTSDGSLSALVIPGGDTYAEPGGHAGLIAVAEELARRGIPVAAICGATYLLARAGLLDSRHHTSNTPSFLEPSDYGGSRFYVDAPVVTDQGITTASGIHAIPFTAQVIRVTGLFPLSIIDAWERLHLTGAPEHYTELMEATNAWQNT